jgi:hypothetical protein
MLGGVLGGVLVAREGEAAGDGAVGIAGHAYAAGGVGSGAGWPTASKWKLLEMQACACASWRV